jgi:hypothetical protein
MEGADRPVDGGGFRAHLGAVLNMFKSVLWGAFLGTLAGIVVLAIAYLPAVGVVTSREVWDGVRLLVFPAITGGVLMGVPAARVRAHRVLWLLGIAFALYPLVGIGTVMVFSGGFWAGLIYGTFMSVAYFPIVCVPLALGTLLLERVTRPAT